MLVKYINLANICIFKDDLLIKKVQRDDHTNHQFKQRWSCYQIKLCELIDAL